MKKTMVTLLILTLLLSGLVVPVWGARAPDYFAKYLSAADVEKLTGLTGIKTAHHFILVFLNGTGQKILQVRFDDPSAFAADIKVKSNYTALTGIGDQAYLLIPQMPYQINFTKGKHSVIVTTFPQEGLKTYLTVEQLKAVCKLIETRLQEPI